MRLLTNLKEIAEKQSKDGEKWKSKLQIHYDILRNHL